MAQKYYAVERQRTLTLKPNPKPQKSKAWSHDDDLQAHKGQKIRVDFIAGGDLIFDELLEADRFALKVRHDQSVVTLYKHAITGYSFPTE